MIDNLCQIKTRMKGEKTFMKHITGYKKVFCSSVLKFISFDHGRISNEHTRRSSGIKLRARNWHLARWSENQKHEDEDSPLLIDTKAQMVTYCVKESDRVLIIRNVAIKVYTVQNERGSLAWKYRAFATFNKCWCLRSTTKLCCGRSTQENWCKTPFSRNNSVNLSSYALLDRNTLMDVRNWVSTMRKNRGTTWRALASFSVNKPK